MKELKQVKTLDDLMMHAAHCAEECMARSGFVPPILFLIGNNGPTLYIPDSFGSTQDNVDFVDMARLICIARNASACVVAVQSRMEPEDQPDGKPNTTEKPSEPLADLEVIELMGDDRNRKIQQFFPIIRTSDGKFSNLNKSESPVLENRQGCFVQILTSQMPDEQRQASSKALVDKYLTQTKSSMLGIPVER